MKTKDGYEVKQGHYYYLENGQEVMLNKSAITPEGEYVFLVTPFYEGETMTVSGDGGYHHEISMDYEHEGLETLVNAIFAEPPLDKLHATYKSKMEEIESLSIAVGILKTKATNLKMGELKLKTRFQDADKRLITVQSQIKDADIELTNLRDNISEKRQKLSTMEDAISTLKTDDISIMIDKKELQRLNRRDFELDCLEAGGIDNWEWYDESLKDFRERYPACKQ